MAKPNYAFQKRQKELAKKQKKEEKRLKKQAESGGPDSEAKPAPQPPEDGSTPA